MGRVGDLQVDLRAMASFLVDVETTRGLQSEKEGLAEVQAELYGNQQEFGAAAKINDEEIKELQTYDAQIQQIDEALPIVEKLLEKLQESRAVLDDKRERQLHSIAELVDITSKKNPDLLAKYERVRRYRSATALKGVKTREKKNSNKQP
jgi:hypothetical protein